MENIQQVLPSLLTPVQESEPELPFVSTITLGKAQSAEEKMNMLKKMVIFGGLKRLQDQRNAIRQRNRQITAIEAQKRGNPFLRDLLTSPDSKTFYAIIEPDPLKSYFQVKERLKTDISKCIKRVRRRPSLKKGTRFFSDEDSTGQKWCIIEKEESEFYNFNPTTSQVSIFPSTRSIKKWSAKKLYEGPRKYRRNVDYQSLQPCLEMFTGQNCGISYVADNPIINNATQKVLKELTDTLNEFRTRLDGKCTKLEGFMSLELKLQKNINVSLEQANCLIQLLYAEFVKKFGGDLQKINYAFEGRPMVLEKFTIDSQKDGWERNVTNFVKISSELLRIIDGYWILQKINTKNFSKKDCYQIIRYSMKLQYNINLLTKQKMYFESQDKNSRFKTIKYPTTLEIVKTQFKERMKQLRTQR